MLQRIQTVYLVLAVALCVACLCLPIGRLSDATGETVGTLYNLWVHVPARSTVGQAAVDVASATPVLAETAQGTHVFTPWALFALLLLVSSGLAFSIFLWTHRLVQSRLVMLCCILLVGWYAVYAFFALALPERFDASFELQPYAAFPAMACIFGYLAFRGILKDEMLVRSLDRLR